MKTLFRENIKKWETFQNILFGKNIKQAQVKLDDIVEVAVEVEVIGVVKVEV